MVLGMAYTTEAQQAAALHLLIQTELIDPLPVGHSCAC